MGPNIVVQADQQYYKINLGIQIITLLRSILVIVIAIMGLSLEVVFNFRWDTKYCFIRLFT